jgi:hypothetical protein
LLNAEQLVSFLFQGRRSHLQKVNFVFDFFGVQLGPTHIYDEETHSEKEAAIGHRRQPKQARISQY